jgi:hypothetical protein
MAKAVSTHLEYGGTLESDQHEARKQTEPPILVQTPQRHTEQLKHKEWRDGVLGKQFRKLGDGDLAEVGAELGREVVDGTVQREVGLLGRGRAGEKTGGLLKGRKVRRGVTRVR